MLTEDSGEKSTKNSANSDQEQQRKRSKPGGNTEKIKPIRSEREVGILLHLGKHEKFDAVVKQRYSDFHVNEIDPNGRIVRLTSYDLPKDAREPIDESDPVFAKWLDEDVRTRIQTLHLPDNDDLNQKKSKGVEINVSDASKVERTKIHRWLSTLDNLTSETLDKDGQKFIVVSFRNSKVKRFDRRPAGRGRFTHCVLYKEGIDTSEAIVYLSMKLKLRPNHISFAGTKDKQAKTTQRICFSNIDASRLLVLNQYSTQSRLGNFEYQDQKLNLGDLSGNHFKLLLKNISANSDSVVDNAIQNLRTCGFINYFGLQRFGSYATPTHVIGKAIIQMQYDKVFDLILEPKPTDSVFMTAAKKVWFTKRDAQAAAKIIPSWIRSIESLLLSGLSKYYATHDYQSALSSLPRNMRLLYIHAYQSYIWNRVASYRIREYGLVPTVGDLVYADRQQVEASVDTPDVLDDAAEVHINGDGLTANTVPLESSTDPNADTVQEKIPKVKCLTNEELSNYTIYDIVIPLEGTDIKYPKNKVADYFDELFVEGGIGHEYLEKFRSRPDTPKGAYRKLVVLPRNVSYRVIPYSNSDDLDKFIPSDLDLMEPSQMNSELPEISTPDLLKDKKCLVLELSLPTSAYATMALREILLGEEPVDDPTLEVKGDSEEFVEVADGAKKPRLSRQQNE